MAHGLDGSGPGTTENEDTTKLSRRRPGRREDVHPSLIPLLRGTASLDIGDATPVIPELPSNVEATKDDLTPVRGILFAALLSAPIWVILGFIVHYLRR